MFILIVWSILSSIVRSQCPTSDSGRCAVDCTRAAIYNIACENINGADLYKDLKVYNGVDQQISLFVWNSPLSRIGYTILRTVQLDSLELDNLQELRWFPELRGQKELRFLTIMNSPNVKVMPLELLPDKIERLTLFRVGIIAFTNDLEEVPQLPALTFLAIQECRIEYIQPGFFDVFPNLSELEIIGSTFAAAEYFPNMFRTVKPLRKLRFSQSQYADSAVGVFRERMLEDIIQNTGMAEDAQVDVADNSLMITLRAASALENLRSVKILFLRGNSFGSFVLLMGRFLGFSRLEVLDMSNTHLFTSTGAFAGLKNLKTLKIASNNLRDLTVINIFKDCQANLRHLDLSDNALMYLPIGMEAVSRELTELVLNKNILRLRDIVEGRAVHNMTTFSALPKLEFLDISENNLGIFQGTWLSRLKTLLHLNIACNSFQKITKDFFKDLPATLQVLNMTFCVQQPINAPRFDDDAFITLPAIKTLILREGFLREGIFNILRSLRIETLETLDLDYNSISNIPGDLNQLSSLASLQTLKLKANKLQSIGPKALAFFTALRELNLARNHIISIGKDDFAGLDNLRTLSIAGNNIIEFEAGALAPLISLQELYMGENNDTDLLRMFPLDSEIGKNLIHLSLHDIPLKCVPGGLIKQLKRLKWLYLDASRAVNFQFTSFRGISETFNVRYPFKLFGFDVPTVEDIGCQTYQSWDTVYNESVRFVVQDRSNLVPQHMIVNIPTCHVEKPRNLKAVTDNLVC
ncbi:toll-like receptor 7 [Paramacrobiotus metropolitanus]|uniref:toll-like receptor 7 n=1 Tax=Paramacrobiotus metropolitanus TaxID=2943436 RepID=UPI002446097E|nr:toll-like receptor 7 [Paramacrobiotus metropolitanus]